ncbi:UxaA family hydrolase [Candidatus Epulonipiscium viviparus]|uniref:UxaA family hydrolase n=1 Tax=Candidatus Epulonipiscium viviparus TaxID=420336 RepID=UPI0027380F17|nr:altronate dehydratase family protein [Candidatus Epulopiscium viviparus]
MKSYIKINKDDNVVVALTDLHKGEMVEGIALLEEIAQGHKAAIANIVAGECAIKYGAPIGYAKENIAAGAWVHTHNIKTTLGDINEYTYTPAIKELAMEAPAVFEGYKRKNGKVGIRNEIFIIPTVGCVNNIAGEIARRTQNLLCTNIEAIVAYSHPYGCSQMGEDQENTKKILANLINHPNAGAVLVLGLGCENSNIEELKKYIGEYDPERVKFVVCQEEDDEIAHSVAVVEALAAYAKQFKRETCCTKDLIVGLKCGGSDGLSGITANPAVGEFSDILIAKGGITILTEVPEMFGAERLLMDRCESEEVFSKTVKLINDFKEYFISHNQVVYENPSPGNKKGGISTLEDKSLGCTQKAGKSKVVDVLEYGETAHKAGLNLLSSPGNDLVAATALAASGAQIVLFTTGRGTPFASPVPTIKISSNSALSNKKQKWIDFDCGKMATEEVEIGKELFEYVLAVASGKKVNSEILGIRDMAIFKQGVTL